VLGNLSTAHAIPIRSERALIYLWVKDEAGTFRQRSREYVGLAPTRISRTHSQRCCFGGGFAAEPAITEAGGTRAAASGRLSWRAHHQEKHIRLAERPPDHIVLYQKNIEAVCSSDAEVREQIRLTVIHDLGHYFGLDEEQLKV
jgi:hypothetical protein